MLLLVIMMMFEKYLNKKVKIVVQDGDKVRSARGILSDINDNFFELEMDTGSQVFNLQDLKKMRLDEVR